MPKSLLSDYSGREIRGEVLLHETRACFLVALGSHWSKSNKTDSTQLCTTSRGLGELSQNIKVSMIRKNSAVDLLSLFQLHLPFMMLGL